MYCVNFVAYFSVSLIWQLQFVSVVLCFLLEIFKIVYVSDKWINFVLCMLCWNLLCSFTHVFTKVWGSWVWGMHIWFLTDSLVLSIFYLREKERPSVRTKKTFWLPKILEEHFTLWLNNAASFVLQDFFHSFVILLFAANYILMSTN